MTKYFILNRTEDKTGISGEGIIAEGIEFQDGKCVLHWLTEYSSIAIYDDIETLMAIHGHDGSTEIISQKFISNLKLHDN